MLRCEALQPSRPEGDSPEIIGSAECCLWCEGNVLLFHFVEKYMGTTCAVQYREKEKMCGPENYQIHGRYHIDALDSGAKLCANVRKKIGNGGKCLGFLAKRKHPNVVLSLIHI